MGSRRRLRLTQAGWDGWDATCLRVGIDSIHDSHGILAALRKCGWRPRGGARQSGKLSRGCRSGRACVDRRHREPVSQPNPMFGSHLGWTVRVPTTRRGVEGEAPGAAGEKDRPPADAQAHGEAAVRGLAVSTFSSVSRSARLRTLFGWGGVSSALLCRHRCRLAYKAARTDSRATQPRTSGPNAKGWWAPLMSSFIDVCSSESEGADAGPVDPAGHTSSSAQAVASVDPAGQ